MNMQEDIQNVQKVKYLQGKFRADLSILQKTKEGLLKLFRSKLEEKKIEEIKNQLFTNTNASPK